jgi:hypothetical protein
LKRKKAEKLQNHRPDHRIIRKGFVSSLTKKIKLDLKIFRRSLMAEIFRVGSFERKVFFLLQTLFCVVEVFFLEQDFF